MPRPRHITIVVLGTLAAAGLAAGARAGRVRDSAPVAAPATSPPDPVPTPAPPARRRPPRRIAALASTLGVAVLLFAGSAWPGERPNTEQPSAAQERAQADASQLALLGKLNLAGIAMRRAGPPRAAVPQQPAAPGPDEQELALARYMTAVGTDSVEATVTQSGAQLAERVLSDDRIVLDSAGSADVASGRVDARVLALLLYLAEAHGKVTVSCLISGHSHFVAQSARDKKRKRPRVVSAHVYGRAVDVSALGGIPIVGNQQPGGITDLAIHEILSLPPALQPAQVISLLDLSGPSFRLPDHADHLHIGY